MARPPLRVRPATQADLPALLELGAELREQVMPAADGRRRGGGDDALQQRYCQALEDPDRHLVVVVGGAADGPEDVLGMALFAVGPANVLLDAVAVHMSHAVVADRHRRRGAGRALVAAAAAFADERGVDQLVVSVAPGSREANRFFARLGFAPVAVRRSAPVAGVLRRLAAGEVHPAEHLVRRRRRTPGGVRSALPLGPATGGPLDPEG